MSTILSESTTTVVTSTAPAPSLSAAEWLDGAWNRVPPLRQKLDAHPWQEFRQQVLRSVGEGDVSRAALLRTMTRLVDAVEDRAEAIRQHLRVQEAALEFAVTPAATAELVLKTCRFLGATARQLRADRRALKRWFDWEGVRERAEGRLHQLQRVAQMGIRACSRLLEVGDNEAPRLDARSLVGSGFLQWTTETLEGTLPVWHERELLEGWARWPRQDLEHLSRADLAPLRRLLRSRVEDAHGDVWVQLHATWVLLRIDPVATSRLITQRFENTLREPEDSLFYRRGIFEQGFEELSLRQRLALVRHAIESDPSPHVRQGAVLALRSFPRRQAEDVFRRYWVTQVGEEEEPRVRAVWAWVFEAWLQQSEEDLEPLQWLVALMLSEESPKVLAVGLRVLEGLLTAYLQRGIVDLARAEEWCHSLLRRGSLQHWGVSVRRGAEDLLEQVRLAARPEYWQLRETLSPQLRVRSQPDVALECVAGGSVDQRLLGRTLASLSRHSDGLYATHGRERWRIRVGPRKNWRLWKFLHESAHPAPDKRQGYRHTQSWCSDAQLRAHSERMAEESPTKVPGEGVKIGNEGSWRRFLPPVYDFLDALRLGEITVFSSQGIVTITPPVGIWTRIRCFWRLSRHYAELAQLRDACQLFRQQRPVNAYIEALRRYGFEVHWEGFVAAEWCTATPFFAPSESASEAIGAEVAP